MKIITWNFDYAQKRVFSSNGKLAFRMGGNDLFVVHTSKRSRKKHEVIRVTGGELAVMLEKAKENAVRLIQQEKESKNNESTGEQNGTDTKAS